MTFTLNSTLKNNTYLLQETSNSLILLSKNSLVPWFLLVPKTQITEWYLLSKEEQIYLNEQICLISKFLKQELGCYKINIANIGNVVSQMHIHVVGRNTQDLFWPDVIWGKQEFEEYTTNNFIDLSNKFLDFIK